MIPLIAFCSSLLLLFSSEPRPQNEWFSGHLTTSDELYWNGQRYYIDASPIGRFEDYVGLYPRIPDPPSGMEPLYDRPRVHDKNYSIRWKIADSMLYVCDVNFAAVGPYEYRDYFLPDGNARFGPLETLTGERFDRDAPAAEIAPVGPCGVLPARWYTGELYLKPCPDWEFTEYDRWIEMPVLRLTFDRGRVTEVRRMKGDLLPDPDRKEAWRQRDPLLGVPRVASVTTSDELEWDGLRYNMSETPLTAFLVADAGPFPRRSGQALFGCLEAGRQHALHRRPRFLHAAGPGKRPRPVLGRRHRRPVPDVGETDRRTLREKRRGGFGRIFRSVRQAAGCVVQRRDIHQEIARQTDPESRLRSVADLSRPQADLRKRTAGPGRGCRRSHDGLIRAGNGFFPCRTGRTGFFRFREEDVRVAVFLKNNGGRYRQKNFLYICG